ncbi:MAG: DUF3829 domain-containing protein [Oxalobacter sp.]|nr:DUF3829 domain-containing protein [Oxalobacter sp.]
MFKLNGLRRFLPVLMVAGTCFLSGCYFAIPTMVETVNQNRNIAEAEGAALESPTGAIKLFERTDGNRQVNAYVRGYNSMMVGQWSLMPSYHVLTTKTMKADGRSTVPYPMVKGLESGIQQFRQGLAMRADEASELDTAVQEAVIAAEKLLMDEKTSLPYFRNQGYRQDGMRGAKTVLPILKGDYDRLIAVMNRIGDQLLVLQKQETERRIQVFADNHDKVGYYAEQCLLDAQDLMAFLKQDDIYKKRIGYQYADIQVQELHRSLDGLKTAAGKSSMAWDENRGLGAMYTQLHELVELYGSLKQGQRSVSYNRMMRRYSDAVMQYNAVVEAGPSIGH